MSQITRCPACDTLFKVVPDQLRVSDGWARCGQCDEVFDANAHLHSEETAAPVEPEKPAAYDWGTIVDSTASADSGPVVEKMPEPEWSPPDDLEFQPDGVAQDPILAMSPQELDGTSPVETTAIEDARPIDVGAPEPRYVQAANPGRPGADETAISFMHRTPQAAAGASRVARAITVAACVTFSGVLVGQWLVYDRDRIAATHPGVRHAMDVICSILGCKVAPLRHIESVVIDSSSFAKVRADVYRLGFTLKNTAPMELASPSLELTMTDTQDQTLVRRVFSPAELESEGGSIAAGAEWTVSVPVAFKPDAGTERIAGYRLLAFYP
jgi:predicted Zn finger-like uncharacterized protein